ncbi:hypothetical protein [Nocardia blacklockiae]|nr:hypothetical protein [Nocardia blacklockiae]MBF6172162.1 hypothetical protein [Nocardia blacklockiae]
MTDAARLREELDNRQDETARTAQLLEWARETTVDHAALLRRLSDA